MSDLDIITHHDHLPLGERYDVKLFSTSTARCNAMPTSTMPAVPVLNGVHPSHFFAFVENSRRLDTFSEFLRIAQSREDPED